MLKSLLDQLIFTMLMTRLLMMTAIENDDDDDVIVMIELLSWPVGEPPSISLVTLLRLHLCL